MFVCESLPKRAGLQSEIGDVCVVNVAQLLCDHVRG